MEYLRWSIPGGVSQVEYLRWSLLVGCASGAGLCLWHLLLLGSASGIYWCAARFVFSVQGVLACRKVLGGDVVSDQIPVEVKSGGSC